MSATGPCPAGRSRTAKIQYDAVVREVAEETGYEAQVEELLVFRLVYDLTTKSPTCEFERL
jgi:8-oxo-dGTP pyrophosphatase MutT (NUDIX family)